MRFLQMLFSLIGIIMNIFPTKTTPIYIEGKTINAEVADTSAKMAKGLMFRDSLNQDSGMFFIFPHEARHTFWMANTQMPLDIIWIDKDLKIVHIATNAVPCEEPPETLSNCPSYKTPTPAKYVLEVTAGWVEQNGILEGDQVEFAQ